MTETIVTSLNKELTVGQIIMDFRRLHADRSRNDILISLANAVQLSDLNFYYKKPKNLLATTDAGRYQKFRVQEGTIEIGLRRIARDGWHVDKVNAVYDSKKIKVSIKDVTIRRKELILFFKDKDIAYPQSWETGSEIEHNPTTTVTRERRLNKAMELRNSNPNWTQKKIAEKISKDESGQLDKTKTILRQITGKIPRHQI